MTSTQNLQDYRRIAQVIDYLREHYRSQPSLAELAAHCGLSESHFQRLFTRWAGISPKRFIQYLTVEYAKRCMQDSASLLDVSFETGLSGSGRLHDLFVTMEAMSPGEVKRLADGMLLQYGVAPSPFGDALIGFTARGICHLSFHDECDDPIAALSERWPLAIFQENQDEAKQLAQRIFTQPDPKQPVSIWVSGSNFQIQVWKALLNLPSGHLWSYQQLAQRAGSPKAARAVGTAMAKNRVALLIPCHRVLRESGEVGLYHWGGATRKSAMLAYEASQRHSHKP
jgi:AraC family transcriptional regulator of adaptative response/methylated-DNA-[protein]-cysteine methyltransferase